MPRRASRARGELAVCPARVKWGLRPREFPPREARIPDAAGGSGSAVRVLGDRLAGLRAADLGGMAAARAHTLARSRFFGARRLGRGVPGSWRRLPLQSSGA